MCGGVSLQHVNNMRVLRRIQDWIRVLQRPGSLCGVRPASCRILRTPQSPDPDPHPPSLLLRSGGSCRNLQSPGESYTVRQSPGGSYTVQQSPAGSCRILQSPAGSCRVPQSPGGSCRILQSPAGSCRIRQSPAGSCRVPQSPGGSCRILQSPAGSCRIRQSPAGSCGVPQSPGGSWSCRDLQSPAGLQLRRFSLSCCRWKDPGDDVSGEEEEDEEFDDEEVDQLFQVQVPAGLAQQHRVFIVHPDVKWGSRKQHLTTAQLMLAEAEGLVRTLDGWSVLDSVIMSTKTPDKKRIFGKGNFQSLTERIRRTVGVTAVFVNVERLSAVSERDLEESWGVQVLDRYSLVLHIFRCNARTREAKLQISLAEIPLLRSRLKNDLANLDQQGGGARYIGGAGETLMEVQQRVLRERELRIRGALERLRRKRRLLRSQREVKEFPTVSVLGYTNCGKTTLIQALTGDSSLRPRDQLFATLDVTVHAGRLPGHMTVLYVDTIGFLSQLPHQLIDSFSATLDDIKHSDVLVHVRDVSHPETENQKQNVVSVLKNLDVPERLMDNMIEVHNKTDLLDGYQVSGPRVVSVSALHRLGLDALKTAVEDQIVTATGRRVLDLQVDLSSPQLSWLYREAVVQDVKVDADDGSAIVKVVISAAAFGRYRKQFANGES